MSDLSRFPYTEEQKLIINSKPDRDYRIVAAPGSGKCLGKGTLVLRFDGTKVPVEEIGIGDKLMGPDSKARTVLSLTHGHGQLYRIYPVDGASWVCNENHILTLVDSDDKVFDIELMDYLRGVRTNLFGSEGYRKVQLFRVGVSSVDSSEVDQKPVETIHQYKDVSRTGFTVSEGRVGWYYGFTLDGDGRFLLGDFTVTHNSQTVIEFAAALLDQHKIDPHRIAMVTFSVTAAREMSKRLAELTSRHRSVTISTLHSLCFKICNDSRSRYSGRLPDNWASWKTDNALNEYMSTLPMKRTRAEFSKDRIAKAYEASKRKPIGVWLSQSREKHEPVSGISYADVFAHIEQAKARAKAIEFDDMPQFALEMLTQVAPLRGDWSNKFRYIIVDEFQDTDLCQYEVLLHLISGQNCNIMTVFDPDQSIFSFRGADPDVILTRLGADRPTIVDAALSYNFRSGKKIIDIANHIIKPNYTANAPAKVIIPHKEFSGHIMARLGVRPLVMDELPKIVKSGNCPLHEIAVLNRYNASTIAVEALCIENNIPYYIYGDYSIKDNRAVKALVSYLRLVLEDDDNKKMDEAFEAAVAVPTRKIQKQVIKDILTTARASGISALAYIEKHRGAVSQRDYVNQALKQMSDTITDLRDLYMAHQWTFDTLVQTIRQKFAIDQFFVDDPDPCSDPAASMDSFGQIIKDYTQLSDLDQLQANIIRLKGEDKRDRVQLLTGHKAKGLEFETVFIHADEDSFPKKDSDHREERRLFYVMVTRAKRLLMLSGTSPFIQHAITNQEIDSNIDYSSVWSKSKAVKIGASKTPLFDIFEL